jgi:hypothetical protein
MKEMMRSLGKYVRKKKLEVNVEKTKMIVFNKRRRKSKESEWMWEGTKVERVSEFKYLDYTFNERDGQGTHDRGSEQGEQGNGMCVGNRKEKVRK